MSAPKHIGITPMEFPYTVGYSELYDICVNWHGGQWSAMYSISSTGTIHDIDTLRGLTSELRAIIRIADAADRTRCVESGTTVSELGQWLKWADDQQDMIDAMNGDL